MEGSKTAKGQEEGNPGVVVTVASERVWQQFCAPTINLNVIIDVSVPARTKTGVVGSVVSRVPSPPNPKARASTCCLVCLSFP